MIGSYTMEEMTQFASHGFRPVVPGNPAHLPEGVGYAEAMNAGKSRYNEDQVRSILIILTRAILQRRFSICSHYCIYLVSIRWHDYRTKTIGWFPAKYQEAKLLKVGGDFPT